MDSLRNRTLGALSWSFLQAAAQRGLQFVIGIILARLLFPEQFGLIGMLTIFTAVIRTFLDSGFGAALIQKRTVDDADASTIFYFNILVGALAAGLLWLAAPAIAAFYRQPVLTSLTRALSLTVVIDAFGMVQATLLTRRIDFRSLTKVSFVAGAASGTVGIGLALGGFGVWSLAAQQVAASLAQTVCLWGLNSWRPSPVFSFRSLRGMFGFGSRLLLSGVLHQIFENLSLLVIGRLFPPASLGYFTRAKALNDMPSMTLSELVGRVTFPVFSSVQDDPARVKRGMRKALRALVLINFPMMIGLAVVARPVVVLLLTEKWLPAVPYLQLLCVTGALYPLHVMNLNVLQALGRSDLFLRLEVLKKAMIALNLVVMWRWGIPAIIVGMIVTSLAAFYANGYYNGKTIGYPPAEQTRDIVPYLAATLAMAGAVAAVGSLFDGERWLTLLAQVLAGIAVYAALCSLFRLEAFLEVRDELAARWAGPAAQDACRREPVPGSNTFPGRG